MTGKIRYIILILISLLLFAIISCSDNSKDGPMGPIEPVITISPAEVTITESETVTFSAVGGNGTYYWETTQHDIGTIDSAGLFTAISAGEATIICTDTENLSAIARITVRENVVQITPNYPTIEHDSTVTFTAANGVSSNYFWWCEPATLYGTISQQGIFTSRNVNGAVMIYASDDSNNVGTAQLTINGISITVSPSTVVLHVGDTQEFEAIGGTEQYTWTSSDTTVGTVEATGTIVTFTPLSAGTTTLTATDTDNFTGTASVTVATGAGDIVTVLPTSVTVEKTNTYLFTATGGALSYVWDISDPSVGSIDSAGLFTAGKVAGTVTVTATDTEGNIGTASVEVVDSPVTLNPQNVSINIGTDITFVATGGTGLFWWSVTDVSKATISSQVNALASMTLTAVEAGTITLYAVDDNGNIGSTTVTITGTQDSQITISPADITIAVDTDIIFIASGGTGLFWWSVTDEAVATLSEQTDPLASTTLSAVTTGTITLYAVDSNGSVGSTTVTIN